MSDDGPSRFDAAYLEGVVDEVAPPAPDQASGRELLLRAAPAEAVALRGCVLTPDRAIEDGYVVVTGKRIEAV
jgi:5-methylthioadenosine/S-adenosylhomocysteine deaminase